MKQQKTWGMANFTTNTINVEIWDIITYKVSFWNSGNVAATGQVKDVLPPCVKYVSSSIHLPSWVTYTWPLTGQQWVQDVVIYKNFKLNPWKWWYMLVTAEIKWNWVVWVNCSNVTWYLNTWYFKFDGGNRLTSDVLAVRPQVSGLIIQKEVLTAWVIHPWDTVNYKITLTNPWNATYHNAYILDSLPPSLEYQTSNIQWVSNYLFTWWASSTWRYNIKYYNFNVNSGQSVVVYLTAILKEDFNVNEITNCSATSWAISCVWLTVPYIKKWQQLWNTTNVNGNWTTEILNVNPGSFISYRVDFGNFWNTWVYGEVKDILPECVTYVRSSLVGVSGTPVYNTGSHTVTATNLYLAPRVMWHLMVVWKVTTGGNCSSVYSYLNTWAFHFVWEERDYSEVEAVRPNATDVRITKEVSPTGPVQSWQLLTYTINYENKWPETLWTYTIVDYWPSDKLDYSGVVSMTPTADNYPWQREWSIVRWTFTTPLPVNWTWQIVIQWTVR